MTYLRNALLRRAAAAVAVLLAGSAAVRADFTLDGFDNPAVPVTANQTGPGSGSLPSVTFTPPGATVTATRTINYTVTQVGSGTATYSLTVGGGALGADLGLSAAATTSIGYTFSGPVDFIPNVPAGGTPGSIEVTGFGQADANGNQTGYSLTVLTAGGGSLTATGSLTSVISTNAISLAGLTGTGDLSQVTGLTLTLNSGAAADLQLDSLAVTTPAAPDNNMVPAPPAVLLALAAVPALGLRRRFARKTA